MPDDLARTGAPRADGPIAPEGVWALDAPRAGNPLARPETKTETETTGATPTHRHAHERHEPNPRPRTPLRPRPKLEPESPSSPSVDLPRRRREPRFHALEDRIWMQWWSGDEYNGLSARLVNVSRHGALIVAAVLLREGQPVRLFLEQAATPIGIDAIVRGVIEGPSSMHKIRFEFLTPCPDSFLEAVAHGFEAWLAGQRARV